MPRIDVAAAPTGHGTSYPEAHAGPCKPRRRWRLGDAAGLTQFVAQGLLAGLGGTWTFTLAIRHLGAARAALSGALVPVLSALGGAILLGETPTAAVSLGIALTILGTTAAAWPASAPQPAAGR